MAERQLYAAEISHHPDWFRGFLNRILRRELHRPKVPVLIDLIGRLAHGMSRLLEGAIVDVRCDHDWGYQQPQPS